MNKKSYIGDKIRLIRTLKGLSQENMAAMLNVSLMTYGDIERNKKDVPLNRLNEIATILGVSIQDILTLGESVNNFFDKCSQTAMFNHNVSQSNNVNEQLLALQLENAKLEIEKLKLEKEKLELVLQLQKS